MQNCSLDRKSPDLSRLVFLEVCLKVVCISKVLFKKYIFKVFLKEYFLNSCLSGTIGEPMGSAS